MKEGYKQGIRYSILINIYEQIGYTIDRDSFAAIRNGQNKAGIS